MPVEIERKFLVKNNRWRNGASGTWIRQGYLCADPLRTVRVRLEGDRGTLTIKGKTEGISRSEFEYSIPAGEAQALLDGLCMRPQIEKTRYRIEFAGLTWEVDLFEGDNAGLVLAEVELSSPDQKVELPDWIGQEVSADPRYYNANLARHPYGRW